MKPPYRPNVCRCGKKVCYGYFRCKRCAGLDRGTDKIDMNGYVKLRLPDHPCADKQGRVYEHRLVMEILLGRRLYDNENVHHRNGVRNDNRPENLELWTTHQPAGQRVTDKLKWAREIIALYEPIEDKL